MTRFLTVFTSFLILIMFQPVQAQENPLSVFESFTSIDWVGHYSNPEDSHYVHKVKFEFNFDSFVVTHSKNVDELNFKMETQYFYDWSKGQLSCFTLLNKKMYSKGVVEVEANKFTILGQNFFEGGSSEFKNSFEIDENGKLIDRFYRKKGDKFVPGHLITYEAVKK